MNTQTDTHDSTTLISRKRLWTARVLGGLAVAFLLFDSGVKLLRLPPAAIATVQLSLIGLGLVELACIIAYLVPATSVLGAVLLTGYLGGAIASYVRVGEALVAELAVEAFDVAVLDGLAGPDRVVRLPRTGPLSLERRVGGAPR